MDKKTTTVHNKPLQRVPWSEKIKDDKQWFKNNIHHYIGASSFTGSTSAAGTRNLDIFYGVYNNQFPLQWFSHITNPLNAKDPQYKNFPAKIRPVNILRTNLDFLMSDFRSRPFKYHTSNLGEDSYNTYTTQLKAELDKNLQQHLQSILQGEDGAEVPMPEQIAEKFRLSYKDALAQQGQKLLKKLIAEYRIRIQHFKMFKDWIIAGAGYSYKGIVAGELVYERVSPKHIDYLKSEDIDFIEDSEWQVRRKCMTLSDMTDWWYEEFKESQLKDLDEGKISPNWATAPQFMSYLGEHAVQKGGLYEAYHVCWKGKKQVIVLSTRDMLTGEPKEMEVDEDYPILPEDKIIRREWRNEGYEGWWLGGDVYVGMGPINVQRNELVNKSKCKLPYNGRVMSDTHAQPLSVLEIGLPYQILYMIIYRTIELALAKSKGKIFVFDRKAIPNQDGWTEEKFFYNAEARGYAGLDRSQIGVDRSWNQYDVIDLTMYDHIDQLIGLKMSIQTEWDELIGIPRQRRGSSMASDGKAVTEMAVHQSSIVTDTIFSLFEEFIESDLQGLLDLSRYIVAHNEGVNALINGDQYETELIKIDPVQYCSAKLGVVVESSLQATSELNMLKAQIPHFVQNGVGPRLVVEMLRADSVSSLISKFDKFEEQQQAMATRSEEMGKELEQIRNDGAMALAEMNQEFKLEEIEAKGDKDIEKAVITETLRGTFSTFSFGGDGDNNDNGIMDGAEVMGMMNDKMKIIQDVNAKLKEIGLKDKQLNQDMKKHNDEMRSKERDREIKREENRIWERTEEQKANAMRIKAAADKAKAKASAAKKKASK